MKNQTMSQCEDEIMKKIEKRKTFESCEATYLY